MEVTSFPYSPGDDAELALIQRGYRYALALTHHSADAEDLLQEAWLNLCRRYGEAREPMLFTAIRNLFIDRCRRNRVLGFDSLESINEALPAPECQLPGATADVEILLAQLRPGEREAVYLHHIAGHTAEEIGAMTHQPRGTVLSLLHRAMKKMQQAVLPRALSKIPERDRNQ